MPDHAYYKYLPAEGAELFTAILLPKAVGRFPTLILRAPYVDKYEQACEEEILSDYRRAHAMWLETGYAVVHQHCRGRGRSTGDCIPYIHEREDGLALQAWIREQPFYNGELYLKGISYLTSVHYATAPFAPDIRGAVFSAQDSERYNICYRNGFLKKALHGSWYVGMYKAKTMKEKHYTNASFDRLPLKDFSLDVFGEPAPDFDAMLRAPRPTDPHWQTRAGGSDARGATEHARIPILFTTGFYDIYTGGMFNMWHRMDEETRARSALVVSAYDHNDKCDENRTMIFPNGKRVEQFGTRYELSWLEAVRGRGAYPFARGQVTYYRLFENRWATDAFETPSTTQTLSLGDRAVSYSYDPTDPPRFRGGLSCNFGGSVFQEEPGRRSDVVTVYSEPFATDTFVKGKMAARLTVSSDCEDTCFYVRISITTERGDFGLRDDITSLCYALSDYRPHDRVTLDFSFDEHAFLVKRGERLRVDIASADHDHYVRHTNQKGLYSEQTTTRVACNTVYLADSYLILPVK